jgi:hypothetical protein
MMKIEGEVTLTEIYNGVNLRANSGEEFGICMRDDGFEFHYFGAWYEAKCGVVRLLGSAE